MSTLTPRQRYLQTCNLDADLDALPQATLADIELTAPVTDLDAAGRIYAKWGCLLVRGLLADLAPQILADAEAMAREVKDSNYTRTCNALVMPGDKTGRDKQIMLFCPTYGVAASHFRAATDPRVVALLQQMVGPNVEMYGRGMCMWKEPGGGMEKALHQDAPYFYHRDHSFCTAFVHLVPTTEKNGCLRVIPGSRDLGLLEHVDRFSHLALPPEKYPPSCALPIFAEPGDVVFFNYLTIHGSENNWSDKVRPALCMQYRAAEDVQVWQGAAAVERLGVPLEKDQRDRILLSGTHLAP